MRVQIRYDVIKKNMNTRAQVGLNRKDRRRNVRGSFTASNVHNKSVLVVDDVVTTGETASEIAQTLKNAGAKYVVFASVARAVS